MNRVGTPEYFKRGSTSSGLFGQLKPTYLTTFLKCYTGKKTVVLSVADLHSIRQERSKLIDNVKEILQDKDVIRVIVVFNGDIAQRAAIRFAEIDLEEINNVFLIDEFQALLTELNELFRERHVDGHMIVNIGNHDVQSFEYFVRLLEICKEMNVPVLSHIPQAFDFDASRILSRARKVKSLANDALSYYAGHTRPIALLNAQIKELDEYINNPERVYSFAQRAQSAFSIVKQYHRIGNILFVGYCTSSLVIGGGDEGGLPIVLSDDFVEMLEIMGQDRKTCVIDGKTMPIIASAIDGAMAGINELYRENDIEGIEDLYFFFVAHELFSVLPSESNYNKNIDRTKQVLSILLPAALKDKNLRRLAVKVLCGHDHVSYVFGRVPFLVGGQTLLVDAVGSSGYARGSVAIQVVGERITPVTPTASSTLKAEPLPRCIAKLLEDYYSGQGAASVTPPNPGTQTTPVDYYHPPQITQTMRGRETYTLANADTPPTLQPAIPGRVQLPRRRGPQQMIVYEPFVNEFNSMSQSIQIQFVTCSEFALVENLLPYQWKRTLRDSRIKMKEGILHMDANTIKFFRQEKPDLLNRIQNMYVVMTP
jgi:hypothetical protein